MSYDVFISVKSEDIRYARRVYDFLQRHGISVFLSDISMRSAGGTNYQREIFAALGTAKHLVVVASKKANVESGWVDEEWRTFVNALMSGAKAGNIITMLAGRMQARDLPPPLSNYQAIRLSERGLEDLISYLPDVETQIPKDSRKEPEPPPIPRWRWIVLTLVCVVLLGLVAAWAIRMQRPPVLFRLDFNESRLPESVWSKGLARVSDGFLVLTSKPGRGAEIQTTAGFKYAALEAKVAADNWADDTSLGFEQWGPEYQGIRVEDGGLYVTNLLQDRAEFLPIPGWEKIRKEKNTFSLRWTKDEVNLYINGRLSVHYRGELIPRQPLKVRVNASNDHEDTVKVDYIVVKQNK